MLTRAFQDEGVSNSKKSIDRYQQYLILSITYLTKNYLFNTLVNNSHKIIATDTDVNSPHKVTANTYNNSYNPHFHIVISLISNYTILGQFPFPF